jgi:hypothetical protein
MILSFTKRGDDKTGFSIVLYQLVVPLKLSKQYIPPLYVPIKIKFSDRQGEEDLILPFNFDFHFSDPSESTEYVNPSSDPKYMILSCQEGEDQI